MNHETLEQAAMKYSDKSNRGRPSIAWVIQDVKDAFIAGASWRERQADKLLAEKDAEIIELKKKAQMNIHNSAFNGVVQELNQAKDLIREMWDALKDLNGHASASLLFPHKDKMDLCKAQFNTDRFFDKNTEKIKALLGEE